MKNIEVKTINNGYTLEFDGMRAPTGYFYFSIDSLLWGIFLHIGLEMNNYLNMEEVDELIKTAVNWNDNAKCVEEIQCLTEENEQLRRMLTSKERDLALHKNKLFNALEEASKLKGYTPTKESKTSLVNVLAILGSTKALTKKEKELLDAQEEEETEVDE